MKGLYIAKKRGLIGMSFIADWARRQGYADFAAYKFAKAVGGDARLVEQLASYNVTDTQSFNDAVNRMNS